MTRQMTKIGTKMHQIEKGWITKEQSWPKMATISFVSRFAKLKNITKPIKTKNGLVNKKSSHRIIETLHIISSKTSAQIVCGIQQNETVTHCCSKQSLMLRCVKRTSCNLKGQGEKESIRLDKIQSIKELFKNADQSLELLLLMTI